MPPSQGGNRKSNGSNDKKKVAEKPPFSQGERTRDATAEKTGGHVLTDEDLAAIETHCREALPGPWIVTRLATVICTILYPHDGYGTAVARVFEPADAAFVAACREDVPALVAELRRLREAVRWVVTQKGDDLCWRDVYTELASLVPDPPAVDHTPPTDVFLRNCQRFEASMRSGRPYAPETAQDHELPIGEVRP